MASRNNAYNPPNVPNMRKRKRASAYGSYVDEETGEISTVQTSKQVKRAHQKSGKWYKEPTEAELRAWDRDEKKQALADRAAKREENKKLNAAKRVEKERKDEEMRRQMFEAGKITFTQTLAKKDEDQLNLHSWFGGRPRGPEAPKVSSVSNATNIKSEDKEGQRNQRQSQSEVTNATGKTMDAKENARVPQTYCAQPIQDLQENSGNVDRDANMETYKNKPVDTSSMPNFPQTIGQTIKSSAMSLVTDLDTDQVFMVMEDDSAEDSTMIEAMNQNSTLQFKVPPLPNTSNTQRLPLSPMSPSDVNVRNSQTTLKVSSFKSRLESANIELAPSTQAVREILSGICTQDLADDLDYFEKENENPDIDASPLEQVKHSSPVKDVHPARAYTVTVPTTTSFAESVDYDSIFFEIDAAEKTENAETFEGEDDFDDCGLDDSTLLSLPPATQLVSSAHKPPLSMTASIETIRKTGTPMTEFPPPPPPLKRTLVKSESFALEGLEDEDLLAQVDELERSQLINLSTSTSRSYARSKKRVLPWDRPSWSAEVERTSHSFRESDGYNDGDRDVEMSTQDTEILASSG